VTGSASVEVVIASPSHGEQRVEVSVQENVSLVAGS
jgi:hypothetical protein